MVLFTSFCESFYFRLVPHFRSKTSFRFTVKFGKKENRGLKLGTFYKEQ